MNQNNIPGYILREQEREAKEINKIIGSLYGYFVGEALGVGVKWKENNLPKGTWSKGSSMILATIDSMYNNKEVLLSEDIINYKDLMDRLLNWKLNAVYTPFNDVLDMGSATSATLTKYNENRENVFCGEDDINANDSDALLRMLPIAIYSMYCTNACINYNFIKKVSSLTHAHPISAKVCDIFSNLIRNILLSNDLKWNVNDAKRIGQDNNDVFHTKCYNNYLSRLLFEDTFLLRKEDIKTSGESYDTLEAAIWCLLTSNSYSETVLKAIGLGGNADEIGAITGALAGAFYGIENIPKEWILQLQGKNYLDYMVNEFAELVQTRKSINKKREIERAKQSEIEKYEKRKIKATKDNWKVIPMGANDRKTCVNMFMKIPREQMDMLKLGLRPETMDDHWFVYDDEEECSINCISSWTGLSVFKAYYRENGVIYKLIIDRNNYNAGLFESIKSFKSLIRLVIDEHRPPKFMK